MFLIRQRTLTILTASHVCIDICQGAIPALLPTLRSEQHLSYTAAAGLIFATNITSSIIQPAFGYYADRARLPWLLPISLLCAGGGLAAASIAPNYWLLVLSVGLCGVGIAAFHPEATRLMHGIAGRKKATRMSVFSFGGSLGFAIGPLAITLLLLLFGLHGTPALLLPIIAMALLLAIFVRPAPTQSLEQKQEHIDQQDNWWAFSWLTGAVLFRSLLFYGLNTFLPLYWISVLHQSKTVGGTALSVMLFAGLAGTLLGGRWADRYGRRRVVLTAFAILFPSFLLFVLLSPLNILLAWALLVPIGFCIYMPFSVMVVMGQDYLPRHIGTASGVTLGLAVTIGGVAAPLLGRVADLYGISFSLLGMTVVPLLAIGCALVLPKPMARGPETLVSAK